MRRPAIRFRLRTLLIFTLLASLLLAYWGCYYRISRRNMGDMGVGVPKAFDYTGDPGALNSNPDWREGYLRMFFAPANWIDRTFFGGPYPFCGIRVLAMSIDFSVLGTQYLVLRDRH